jgi:hypothetical protein
MITGSRGTSPNSARASSFSWSTSQRCRQSSPKSKTNSNRSPGLSVDPSLAVA